MRQSLPGLAGFDECAGQHRSPTPCSATGPRCAVYNAMADNRQALEDYRESWRRDQYLGSGPVLAISVVVTEIIRKPLQGAARAGNSSLYVNGIDPGFANDLCRWPAPVKASG